jgi:hypothetical protein
MTGATLSATATLSPAVNVNKTFVLVGIRTTDGITTDIGARMVRAVLTNSTTITFDRSVAGSSDITEIVWQAVELKDNSFVLQGSANLATGAAVANVNTGAAIINTQRAVGFISTQGGGGQNMGRSSYVGDDIIGVATATVGLTGAQQVTLTRDSTVGPADLGWFVVQFDAGSPFKVGSFTKATAAGSQSIAHGLGQVPKAMLFWAEGKGDDITLRGTASASIDGAVAVIGSDAIASGDRGTNATTVTTAAFSTVSPNELLLAFVSGGTTGAVGQTVTGITGGGLTWVLVKRTNAQTGTAEVWRAFAAAPLTGVTVTATLSQSTTSSITVMSFTGIDTSGANGSGAIGASVSASAGSGAPTAS